MKGLFDLDLIVHRIGSACDGRHYMYKGQRWESKRSLDKQLIEDGVDTSSIPLQKDPESWETTQTSLVSFLDDLIERSGAIEYRGFISGRGNFRYDIATIQPYKGNRSGIERPYHYDAIRQFLVDVYDAKTSSGMEADDAIGLDHDPERTFIATTDKDLNCIPGLHFNWDKDDCYWVTEIEANRNFYKQILTGDRTDNILGLYGVGPSSAHVKNIDKYETEEEMYNYVFEQYTARFGSYAYKFMEENARLLWILQNRKNRFMV